MDKRILPTQRNMALQKAVKKLASDKTIALSHIEKFLLNDNVFRLT